MFFVAFLLFQCIAGLRLNMATERNKGYYSPFLTTAEMASRASARTETPLNRIIQPLGGSKLPLVDIVQNTVKRSFAPFVTAAKLAIRAIAEKVIPSDDIEELSVTGTVLAPKWIMKSPFLTPAEMASRARAKAETSSRDTVAPSIESRQAVEAPRAVEKKQAVEVAPQRTMKSPFMTVAEMASRARAKAGIPDSVKVELMVEARQAVEAPRTVEKKQAVEVAPQRTMKSPFMTAAEMASRARAKAETSSRDTVAPSIESRQVIEAPRAVEKKPAINQRLVSTSREGSGFFI